MSKKGSVRNFNRKLIIPILSNLAPVYKIKQKNLFGYSVISKETNLWSFRYVTSRKKIYNLFPFLEEEAWLFEECIQALFLLFDWDKRTLSVITFNTWCSFIQILLETKKLAKRISARMQDMIWIWCEFQEVRDYLID